jgi:hypothetical protein
MIFFTNSHIAEGYAVIIPTSLTKQIQTKTQYLDAKKYMNQTI